jgi:uncharacterized protein YyaL (SSP411 family)
MDRVWADYWDSEGGGLFDTARGRSEEAGLLPARAKPVQDTPTPSPNGVGGIVVARLSALSGDARWKQRSEALVRAFAGRAQELGLYAATYLLAVDWQLNPATHLVVVGHSSDPSASGMHRQALRGFVPRRVVQRLAPERATGMPLPPPLLAMLAAGGAAKGYACMGPSCSQPASDLASWRETLESLRPSVPA